MSDDRDALYAAHEEVTRLSTAQVPSVQPRTRSPRRAVLALIGGWSVLLWIWMAKPEAIFGPKPVKLSPTQELAETRYALFLTRQRIEEYQATNGALPAALSDLPRTEEGIHYSVAGSDYTISAHAGRDSLVLTNRMDADSFLGDALQVLQETAQ